MVTLTRHKAAAVVLVVLFLIVVAVVAQTRPSNVQINADAAYTDSRILVWVPSLSRYVNATLDPTTVVVVNPAPNVYTLKAIIPPSPSPAVPSLTRQTFKPTSTGTTGYTVVEPSVSTISGITVYRNGILLLAPDDYSIATVAGAFTVNMTAANASTAGDIVQVLYWK